MRHRVRTCLNDSESTLRHGVSRGRRERGVKLRGGKKPGIIVQLVDDGRSSIQSLLCCIYPANQLAQTMASRTGSRIPAKRGTAEARLGELLTRDDVSYWFL